MHAPRELGLTQRSSLSFCTAFLRSSPLKSCTTRSQCLRRYLSQPTLNVATKEMPKPAVAKAPAFFTNNLSDAGDSSQSLSSLIEPLSHATYDALQASYSTIRKKITASLAFLLWLLHGCNDNQVAVTCSDRCLLQQVIERGMHSGEGLHGCSIYTGTAGVAYMFLRLAEALQHSQSLIAQHPQQPLAKLTPECLLRRADEYGHWAKHLSHCSRTTKRVTFLEGHPGCLALQTAIASLRGNKVQAQHSLQELESWGPRVLQMPATECEVLFGRCGYLHALLFARKYVGPSPGSAQLIKQLLQQVVEEGRRGARELRSQDPSSKWELMWSWHGSYYLGGAHGVCGILLTMMQCYPELQELYPHQAPSLLAGSVAGLLSQTLPSGNLLSSLGSESDKYVQWCHGAPSLIPVLATAAELLEGEAVQGPILEAARKAADVVWERGLLTKGLGLCHGISGNAYSFMSLYRVTKDGLYRRRAQQFAQVMAQHWKQLKDIPDAPLSLYEKNP